MLKNIIILKHTIVYILNFLLLFMLDWRNNFEKAKKHFKIADHMSYITFAILKENRLMIKIFNEITESIKCCILGLLGYYEEQGKIKLFDEMSLNLRTFKEKIAPVYLDSKEIHEIFSILSVHNKHKESSLEFVKRDKFVIFTGNGYETLTIEKIKQYLALNRKLLASIPNTPLK